MTLLPGDSVDLLVPAHELVRVVSTDGPLEEDEIQIWASDGSGLYRKLNTAISSNRQSVFAAPDHSGISVTKVWRPETASGAITLSVFTSRRSPDQSLDYYQCEVLGNNSPVQIADDQAGKIRQYVQLEKGQRRRVRVKGDTRLRIETRLQYGVDPRQHQSYWLRVTIDDKVERILLSDTLPERQKRVFVNDCECLVGRREFAYIDLPAQCQTVKIEASQPVFIRADAIGLKLCRPRVNRNFNLPKMNKANALASFWNEQQDGLSSTMLSQVLIDDAGDGGFKLSSPITNTISSIWDPYVNQHRIKQIARDNRVRNGGLRAYMWMRAIATQHYGDADYGDEITVPDLAARLRNRHTGYRDLLPIELVKNSGPRIVSFPLRKIRTPNQAITQTIVGQQHVSEAVGQLPSSTLFQLSTNQMSSAGSVQLRYHVPENLGNSLLRVVVDQTHLSQPTRFMVQFDDQKPIEMAIIQSSPLPNEALRPSRPEAAIASLSKLHRQYDSGTVGGPFSMIAQPTALIRAATSEFLLPDSVSEIKVWVESCAEPTVHIGLQYLTGKKTKLSEAAFLEHRSHHEGATSVQSDFSRREQDNDSLDFHNFIEAHWNHVASGIQASEQVLDPLNVWEETRIQQQAQSLAAMAQLRKWPAAIENVTELIMHSTGKLRQRAVLDRIQLLESAGEYFLAERERRGWLKFGTADTNIKKLIAQQLIGRAIQNPFGSNTIEQYYSFALREFPDDSLRIAFAQQLLNNGRYGFAMRVIPPDATGPLVDEIRLRCAFQLKWWRTFANTLSRIQDSELSSYWNGMKALYDGKYKLAYQRLQHSGQRGAPFLRHLEWADEIFKRLKSNDDSQRIAAIADWEQWQQSYPGPHLWNPEPSAIASCSGMATLHHQPRDIRTQYCHTSQDQPATVQIHGPVRIRIEGRPVHPSLDSESISDVMLVTSGSQTERFPFINNNPSVALTIEGEMHKRPGQQVWGELELPAGFNEIQIKTKSSDLLFRVHALRPELKLPILPLINEATMAAVVKGQFGHPLHNNCDNQDVIDNHKPITSDCVRLVTFERTCCSLPHCFLKLPCGCMELHSVIPHFEQLDISNRGQWRNRIVPTTNRITVHHQDKVYRRALEIIYSNENDYYRTDNKDRMQQIAELQRLQLDNPNHENLKKLLKNQLKGSTWQIHNQFDSRAGVSTIPIEDWVPETPEIRIRKCLLEHHESDYVIASGHALSLEVSDLQPTQFKFSLKRPRLSFLAMGKTVANWRVRSLDDDRRVVDSGTVELDSTRQEESFELAIAPGNHEFHMEHGNPLANHFLHVNVKEILDHGESIDIDSGRLRHKKEQRQYQVATREEPLKFRVAGPAVMRIDRLVNDRFGHPSVLSRTVSITESQRQFTLYPDPNQELGQFRIFKLFFNGPETPVYRAIAIPSSPPDPWIDNVVNAVFQEAGETNAIDMLSLHRPDSEQVDLPIHDREPLGLQELGTIVADINFQRRRAFEELPVATGVDQFVEARLTRYYHDPWSSQYTQNDLFLRPRFNSGPSFGYNHKGSTKLPLGNCTVDGDAIGWGPVQINWRGYANFQNVGTPLSAQSGSFPWSTGFSATASRRQRINTTTTQQPRLSAFGRLLSEDTNGYPPGEVDQDIFTPYKSEHRYGLRLSNRIVYQSCLDQRWWVRPNLTTNEDQLVPDNLGFQLGAEQLLGPLELHLGYRFTQYLADNDRQNAAAQNVFDFSVKIERWHSRLRRSELTFSMKHNVEAGGTNIGFGLRNFFNHARGYRDFAPDTILFRSLKQERASRHDFYH